MSPIKPPLIDLMRDPRLKTNAGWKPRVGDVVQAKAHMFSSHEGFALEKDTVGIVAYVYPKANALKVRFMVAVSPNNHDLIVNTHDVKFLCHAEETPDAARP